MAKLKKLVTTCLLILLASHLAYSRSIREDLNGVDDSDESNPPSFIEWGLSARTETCEPIYGFLPCSTNVWGLLFLIVVYEILISQGGKFVGIGSNLFFEIIGPGVFGGSLFQFLGTIPQVVLVLVSGLSGTTEAAEQRARLGMGLVAGTTVMLLTLIWGSSVVLGSYNLPQTVAADNTCGRPLTTPKGHGIVTDVETVYTARIMLITLIPFLVLLLSKVFDSSSGKRVVILIALIITFSLLIAYILYQIFRPWIQMRRFDYLMNKYAQDKLLRLLSRNGRPDTQKIHDLFNKIDKDKSSSVSASELRVLLLGVKMDDEDLSTDRDVENILASFDTSGDARINQDEFIRGMTQLISDLSDQTSSSSIKIFKATNSQSNSEAQQPLLVNSTNTSMRQRASNSWLNYFRAGFFVILGTVMLCALSEPLIKSVVGFSQAANLSSFCVSYLAIPFAMNYGAAIQSLASSRQKTQKSISLTLSALYSGVYMNNVIGLIAFLAPVYARNLSAEVFSDILVVLVICILMTIFTSFRTSFTRWMGYLVLVLYPVSLATVFLLTNVLGWA